MAKEKKERKKEISAVKQNTAFYYSVVAAFGRVGMSVETVESMCELAGEAGGPGWHECVVVTYTRQKQHAIA